MEARNLAPLPADIDHTSAAALPISGLTAWQGLFDHARLTAGQTVLIHGVAGGVGSIAAQLAHETGARVIGTGRAAHKDTALGLGVDAFVDLQGGGLEDVGEVDVVFDVIGGQILERSAALVRAGGTLVTIAASSTVRPSNGRAVFLNYSVAGPPPRPCRERRRQLQQPGRHRAGDLYPHRHRLGPDFRRVLPVRHRNQDADDDRRQQRQEHRRDSPGRLLQPHYELGADPDQPGRTTSAARSPATAPAAIPPRSRSPAPSSPSTPPSRRPADRPRSSSTATRRPR